MATSYEKNALNSVVFRLRVIFTAHCLLENLRNRVPKKVLVRNRRSYLPDFSPRWRDGICTVCSTRKANRFVS